MTKLVSRVAREPVLIGAALRVDRRRTPVRPRQSRRGRDDRGSPKVAVEEAKKAGYDSAVADVSTLNAARD